MRAGKATCNDNGKDNDNHNGKDNDNHNDKDNDNHNGTYNVNDNENCNHNFKDNYNNKGKDSDNVNKNKDNGLKFLRGLRLGVKACKGGNTGCFYSCNLLYNGNHNNRNNRATECIFHHFNS